MIAVFLVRWCALAARGIIRISYYACLYVASWLLHLCNGHESTEPASAGVSLSLGPIAERLPEVEASSESMMRVEEEHGDEEGVPEDPEISLDRSLEEVEPELAENMELELSVQESTGEREEDSEIDMTQDNRLEYWDWAHDWEDLDWTEEIWMEDEVVSLDLNEAVLPDELWE